MWSCFWCVTHFPGQNGFWFSMVGQKCKTLLFRENKSLHSTKFSFYTNESLNSFKGSTMLFLNFKGWNRAPLSYCQKQLSLNITNISSPQTTTTWMFNKHILYLMVYKSTKLSWELSRAWTRSGRPCDNNIAQAWLELHLSKPNPAWNSNSKARFWTNIKSTNLSSAMLIFQAS